MQIEKKAEGFITGICLIVCVWIIGCQFLFHADWENKRIGYLIGSLVCLFLLCRGKQFLYRKEGQIKKYFWMILFSFLLVYGTVQLYIGLRLRFEPAFDLEAIYGGAVEWYKTGTFSGHQEYFYRFKNNLGGLLLLYLSNLFLGAFTQDFFLIGTIINCAGLCLTFLLLALICRELWGEISSVICLGSITLMLPFLFMGATFYTDSLSMPYVAGSIFLFLKMKKAPGIKKKNAYAAGLGLCCTLGAWVKGTVWILLIAVMIMLLLQGEKKEILTCSVTMLAVAFLFNLFLNSFFYGKYLNDEIEQEKKLSVTHWIMMGLEGEGSYNPGDYEFSYGIEEAKERKEANIGEIQNRLKERKIMGMIQLFASKTVKDYGEGTLGLSDFLDDNPVNTSKLHDYVLYSGKHFERYQNYCRIILLTFLFLFLYAVNREWKAGQKMGGWILIELAFLGIFAFLMIWESGYRYVSNFLPVIILGAVRGVEEMKEKQVDSYLQKLWKKRSVRVFSYAILFRVLIYVLSVLVMAIFGDYQEGITFSDFLTAWQRWDGSAYLRIAENGYRGYEEGGMFLDIVFFPLYPWLIKAVELMVGNYQLSGIIVSSLCYGIGSVYLDRLMRLEYGEESAQNAALALSVYPFSFFFGSIMTESLFFAIITSFFYYLRKHEWKKATVLGFFACMTKVQGMLLTFAVVAELFYSYQGLLLIKQKKWKEFRNEIIGNGLKCVPMVGGIGIYLLVNFIVEGDAFKFLYYQKNHWGNGLCPIWETMSYIGRNVLEGWYTSTGMSLWLPEFVLFFLYLIGIGYAVKKKMHPTYLVYLIAFFVLTYSSTWLISGARYTLSAIPLFMLIGKYFTEHKRVKEILLPFSFALMIIYMVGYYQWKQIM